jgi:uncharacterized integral membrane protein
MPWRLIGFIIIFGIFLVFIAFNLGNKCDINFGFRVFTEVPVFLTAFSSFILGMFCAMPFLAGVRAKKKEKAARDGAPPAAGRKREDKRETGGSGSEGKSLSHGGPYGVN